MCMNRVNGIIAVDDYTKCKTFKRDGDYINCLSCNNIICPKYSHFKRVEPDMVHRPAHYCYSKYEPKDVIRAWGLNFNLGSAVKYIARAGRKDDILQELNKAKQFIEFEIEAIEKERAE